MLKHGISTVLVGVGAGIVSLPVAAECWKTFDSVPACTYSTCNPDPCTSQAWNDINETTTIAASGGNRTTRTDIDYLCLEAWYAWNPETHLCDGYIEDCQTIVGGSLANGGICPSEEG